MRTKIEEIKKPELKSKEIIQMTKEKRTNKLEPYYSRLPFENIISF